MPIDQVRSYAKAYFGIEELKIDFMSQQYFDGQYITIPLPDEEEPKLPYELEVLRVETVGSRISAVLGLRSGDVLFQQWNYTLRADKKGNVYFESMLKRPVEYGLYAINGPVAVSYTHLSSSTACCASSASRRMSASRRSPTRRPCARCPTST